MIKIVRLKIGLDIVGEVTEIDTNKIHIADPMVVEMYEKNEKTSIVMYHWLPVQLIEENASTISNDEVMFVMNPDDNFEEYYVNSVEKIQKLMKAKSIVDGLTDDEKLQVMDSLEDKDPGNRIFH